MVLPQASQVVLSWQRFEEILQEAGILKTGQAVADTVVVPGRTITLLILK